MSGRPDGKAAPIVRGAVQAPVDPLPQALILTAIVIGFGVTAYLVILLYRTFLDQRTASAQELFDQVRFLVVHVVGIGGKGGELFVDDVVVEKVK